jgi:hypothetical protein
MILAFFALAAAAGYDVAATQAAKPALLAAEEAAWKPAQTIEWGPAPYKTRFRALWKQDGLYLRFDADDPKPWHTMTNRDDHLWDEEVVEIFLDLDGSGRNYAEIEVNPANIICDVRMVRPSPDKLSDLRWNHEGLESRVTRYANSWTATVYLPWAGFRSLSPEAAKVPLPPLPGSAWKFNVFRIERPHGPADPKKDSVFAAWSPTGQGSFHVPAAFREFRFQRQQ